MVLLSTIFFPLTLGLLSFIWAYRRNGNLIESGIVALCFWVVGVALGMSFAKYVFNSPERAAKQRQEQVEQILLGRLEYQAFKQFDPQSYNSLIARLVFTPDSQKILIGSPEWNVSARYAVRTQLLMNKSLQYVSDKAIREYVDVMVDELGALQQQEGELCYSYLYGWPKGTINAPEYFSQTLLDAESKAIAAVVYSSKISAQAPPDRNKASIIFWSVMPKLREEFGDDAQMIYDPYKKDIDKAKLCRITTRFLESARQLPDSDGSIVLRHWVTPHG